MTPAGFPHSDIHGSKLESSSPWHFAGFRVLHRLLVPRHPPCALCSLTCFDVSRRRRSRKPPSDGSSSRFLSSPRTLLAPTPQLYAAPRERSSPLWSRPLGVLPADSLRASCDAHRRKLCYSVQPLITCCSPLSRGARDERPSGGHVRLSRCQEAPEGDNS
jgi:hypothetical protein